MQERVKGPAVALIVVGILGLCSGIFSLVAQSMMLSFYKSSGVFSEEQLQQMEQMSAGQSVISIVGAVLTFAGSGFIIFGALQMMKLRSWPIALIASILAMIPCFSSCACLFGLPVGIWAIIVLANDQVKAAFNQNVTPS